MNLHKPMTRLQPVRALPGQPPIHGTIYKNNLYQVIVRRDGQIGRPVMMAKALRPFITYLSIRRLDRKLVHNWRHLQSLKNELCGDDTEAIEIYPAERDVVNLASQYHLWVFPKGYVLPVGFRPSSDSRAGAQEEET